MLKPSLISLSTQVRITVVVLGSLKDSLVLTRQDLSWGHSTGTVRLSISWMRASKTAKLSPEIRRRGHRYFGNIWKNLSFQSWPFREVFKMEKKTDKPGLIAELSDKCKHCRHHLAYWWRHSEPLAVVCEYQREIQNNSSWCNLLTQFADHILWSTGADWGVVGFKGLLSHDISDKWR